MKGNPLSSHQCVLPNTSGHVVGLHFLTLPPLQRGWGPLTASGLYIKSNVTYRRPGCFVTNGRPSRSRPCFPLSQGPAFFKVMAAVTAINLSLWVTKRPTGYAQCSGFFKSLILRRVYVRVKMCFLKPLRSCVVYYCSII